MRKAELMQIVLKWEATIRDIDFFTSRMNELFGHDGSFQGALFKFKCDYTQVVSDFIGDKEQWLDWYSVDNEMGSANHIITGIEGVDKVENINELIDVLFIRRCNNGI